MKTKEFDIPFIGYDLGSEHGWNYDVLIGKFGNPIIGIKIKNPVEQYSADPDNYLKFHSTLNQVISIVGEGFIVQKTDIFSKKKYIAEPSKQFLQQKYSEHFDGRMFKTIDTILFFTELIDDKIKKNKKYQFSEKIYKQLRDKCQKAFMILQQNDCEPQYLKEKEFDYYIDRAFTMEFSEIPTFNNIKSNNEYLQVGNRFIKTLSFVDVENIELPTEIEPFSYLGGNGAAAETAVDNFSFLNEVENYRTIIYNQIISIPLQAQRQRFLEKKKKQHESAGTNSPSNYIIAQEIDELMVDIEVNSQLIVDAHFSLCFSTDNLEELEKTTSFIEGKLFTKGIRISKNAYNQLELFRACIPGNPVELKDYDLFTTTSEGALSFFFKESYPINEKSNFYLRFTDRQGVPLKIDPADLPMRTGRINNRNKFVLGPSGSGKS